MLSDKRDHTRGMGETGRVITLTYRKTEISYTIYQSHLHYRKPVSNLHSGIVGIPEVPKSCSSLGMQVSHPCNCPPSTYSLQSILFYILDFSKTSSEETVLPIVLKRVALEERRSLIMTILALNAVTLLRPLKNLNNLSQFQFFQL